MKSWLRFLVLCGVSGLALWVAFQGVEFRGLIPRAARANGWLLGLTAGLTVWALFLRAWRWGFFLPPGVKASMADLFIASNIGIAANYLLPAHLGELVRAYALHARAGIRVTTTLATLLVERVLDLAAVLAALGIVFIQLPLPEWVRHIGNLLLMIDAGILMILILLNRYPEKGLFLIRKIVTPLSGRLSQRMEEILTSFVEGLSVFQRGGSFLAALGSTAVLWITIGLAIGFNLHALQIPGTPLNALTVLSILSVGLIIPAGPGFVGTFEFFAIFALGLVGVSRTPALAFAIVFHGIQFFTTVIVGLICLWASGLTDLIPWRPGLRASQLESAGR